MRLRRLYLVAAIAATLLPTVTLPGSASPKPIRTLISQNTQVLETNYKGNILLRVNGVTVQRNGIAVDLEVTNNSPIAINLNSGLPGRGMVLRDDLGNQYSLSPPRGNPAVAVKSGSSLSGTFIFSGRIAANARSLTLITNVGSGQTEVSPTIVPKMTISGIKVQ